MSNNLHVTAKDFFSEFKSEGKTLLVRQHVVPLPRHSTPHTTRLTEHPSLPTTLSIQHNTTTLHGKQHIAATSGHKHIVEAIFDKCANDSERKQLARLRDDNGFTPFMNATVSESKTLMQFFLDKGADVNARNLDGAGAIHFAAGDGSLERLQFLVEKGADIDLPSGGGTPLHWAAGAKNSSDAVGFIAGRCADVNTVNAQGTTAVLTAAAAGHDETVRALVQAKADIGSIFAGNLTLLHICSENGLLAAVEAIVATDVGKKCLEMGTDDGNWPIHLAAMVKKVNVVEFLFDKCAHGMTSLDACLKDGVRRMAAWEEKHQPDTNSAGQVDLAKVNVAPAIDDAAKARAETFKQVGNEHFKKKEHAAAADQYTLALAQEGDNKAVWSNRSACYMALKEFKSALRDAEVCRHLDPNWVKGCYRLATARLACGQYEDAAVAAFEGCKLDEDNEELKSLMKKAVKQGQEAEKAKKAAREKEGKARR
jgi:ankyrin repeat protein